MKNVTLNLGELMHTVCNRTPVAAEGPIACDIFRLEPRSALL